MAKIELDASKMLKVNIKIKSMKRMTLKLKFIAFLLGLLKDCDVDVSFEKKG